ncbi:MAG: MotA/TolQ/ExbB proton channel family protein [Phycisphaerales bacterium]|nr:MotA/TolQ/ExbB proton channel family protein [Phycisphaerales bacterium]
MIQHIIAGLLTAQTESPQPVHIGSVLDFFVKGGWIMAPIGVCSLLALTIIIERAITLRRSRVIPASFVDSLRGIGHDRRRGIEECTRNGSPIANVLRVLLKRRDEPAALLEKHIEEAGQRELFKLRQYMRVLSVLPQASTMLGLLGTVFGMIHAFQAVASSGEALGKPELLAQGIYEAWTATAAGLLVAIPVLIAYHALLSRIDQRLADMDLVASQWLEEITGVSVRSDAAPAGASVVEVVGAAVGQPVAA